MIVAMGLACVVWTVIELARLSQATPSLVGSSAHRTGSAFPSSAASRRRPLAAWDAQGRPIFVEDVSRSQPR
jgi:hypothetical protein